MPKIAFIVPCYNEETTIEILHHNVEKIMKQNLSDVEYEFCLVDDGSKDGTLDKLRRISKKNKNVRYVSFSRNFGKESAMLAGLQYAKGDYITILDADMQDPPILIPKMYQLLNEKQYDCICTRRVTRDGEPLIRSMFAKFFYVLMNKMGMVQLEDGSRDFLMMTQEVRDSILSLGEYVRFFKGMYVWVGFRRKWLEYGNINRVSGESKWSFLSLTKYALIAISSFTVQPLIWPFFFGILFGAIGSIVVFFNFLIGLFFLLFACQFVFMGIFGYYLSTIFLEVKKRPKFLIRETNIER